MGVGRSVLATAQQQPKGNRVGWVPFGVFLLWAWVHVPPSCLSSEVQSQWGVAERLPCIETFSDGYLGSINDEGRSEV